MRRTPLARIVILICTVSLACSRAAVREYELQGQVVAVDPARQEITITHEDIPRFMPGMTMAFKVREARMLEGRVPGDLVKAVLVVRDTEAHLRSLERTGASTIAVSGTPTRVMNLLEPGAPVRDAEFRDQTGAGRRIADWRGQVVAVTFIYTRCPLSTFCPLMDRQFKAVQKDVRRDAALNGAIRLLSVSFDPAHDTPAVLAKHAAALGADPAVWQFLTGSQEQIEDFASQFGISVIRSDPSERLRQGSGGSAAASVKAEIVHNLRTAVIDAGGRLIKVFNGTDWTAADLVAELRTAGAASGQR